MCDCADAICCAICLPCEILSCIIGTVIVLIVVAIIIIVVLFAVLKINVPQPSSVEPKSAPAMSSSSYFDLILHPPSGNPIIFTRGNSITYQTMLTSNDFSDSMLLSFHDNDSKVWSINIPTPNTWVSQNPIVGIPLLLSLDSGDLQLSQICFQLYYIDDKWALPKQNGNMSDLRGIGCGDVFPTKDFLFPGIYATDNYDMVDVTILLNQTVISENQVASMVSIRPASTTAALSGILAVSLLMLFGVSYYIFYRLKINRPFRPNKLDRLIFNERYLKKLSDEAELEGFQLI